MPRELDEDEQYDFISRNSFASTIGGSTGRLDSDVGGRAPAALPEVTEAEENGGFFSAGAGLLESVKMMERKLEMELRSVTNSRDTASDSARLIGQAERLAAAGASESRAGGSLHGSTSSFTADKPEASAGVSRRIRRSATFASGSAASLGSSSIHGGNKPKVTKKTQFKADEPAPADDSATSDSDESNADTASTSETVESQRTSASMVRRPSAAPTGATTVRRLSVSIGRPLIPTVTSAVAAAKLERNPTAGNFDSLRKAAFLKRSKTDGGWKVESSTSMASAASESTAPGNIQTTAAQPKLEGADTLTSIAAILNGASSMAGGLSAPSFSPSASGAQEVSAPPPSRILTFGGTHEIEPQTSFTESVDTLMKVKTQRAERKVEDLPFYQLAPIKNLDRHQVEFAALIQKMGRTILGSRGYAKNHVTLGGDILTHREFTKLRAEATSRPLGERQPLSPGLGRGKCEYYLPAMGCPVIPGDVFIPSALNQFLYGEMIAEAEEEGKVMAAMALAAEQETPSDSGTLAEKSRPPTMSKTASFGSEMFEDATSMHSGEHIDSPPHRGVFKRSHTGGSVLSASTVATSNPPTSTPEVRIEGFPSATSSDVSIIAVDENAARDAVANAKSALQNRARRRSIFIGNNTGSFLS